MNFPFKRLKEREPVPAKEWNRMADAVARLGAESAVTRDDIQAATQGEIFLARIVDREAYESGQSPVYSWVASRADEEGNPSQHPIAMRGDANGYPAYEEAGNPLVPIDGSCIVAMRPGPGPYYLFTWDSRNVWAKLTGSSGALYAWTEVYHAGGTTWSTLTGGRTGTTSVNAAREMRGVTGIANDTIVELSRGHCDGAPRVIVTRQQVGDSEEDSEIQEIRILDAVGGTFTLTHEGQTTSGIAYNADATAINDALEALSNITNVGVTGAGTSADPFVVTFEDDFDEHPFLQPDHSGLLSDQEWVFENPDPWGALPNTSVTLGSNQNNYSLTQTMTYIDASAAISITGFAAPSGGAAALRIVKNTHATNTITFAHESGSSDSQNQISNPSGSNYTLGPKQTGAWIYHPDANKWQPLWQPSGSGITSINGETGAAQTLAVGTAGTDFAIATTTDTNTFNLPDASTTARGAVTTGVQTIAGGKTLDVGSVAGTPPVLTLKNTITTAYLSLVSSGAVEQLTIGRSNTGGTIETLFGGLVVYGGSAIGVSPYSAFGRGLVPETSYLATAISSSGSATLVTIHLDEDNNRIVLSAYNGSYVAPTYSIKIGSTIYDGASGTSGSGDTVKGGIITALGSGTTLADGDYGDITVGGTGTTFTIDAEAVTYAKMQHVSATDKLLGRSTSGAGDVEEIPCTAAGRNLIDDADTAAQRTTLGLAIGTDVQAYDAQLTDLAGLSYASNALKVIRVNAGETAFELATASGGISGSGTENTIPRWTSSSALGDSTITDDGSTYASIAKKLFFGGDAASIYSGGSNQDNYSLGNGTMIAFSTSAAIDFTGMTAPSSPASYGQLIVIFNWSSTYTVTIKHNVTSTLANRFTCPNGVDYPLLPESCVWAIYSNSKWQIVGAKSFSGSTGSGSVVLATSPTITTPTIGDFSNSQHNHQSAGAGGSLDAAAIGSGTLADARIPNLAASKITSGTLAVARGGTGVTALQSFSAYRNTNYSLPTAAWTKIPIDTERFDVGGIFDTTNNKGTPTIAGIYNAIGMFYSTDCRDNTLYAISIYKNGALFALGNIEQITATLLTIANKGFLASGLPSLNGSTDYVELFGYNGHATNTLTVVGGANNNHFDAFWAGPSS